MHSTSILMTISLVLLLVAAAPTPCPETLILPRNADPVAQLLSIAPTAATCDGAPIPAECATASDAAGPIIDGFAKYGVGSAGEQAALIAWMVFESGEFKYNIHHIPTEVPGQGTRCMMGATFTGQYANSIPSLAAEAAKLTDPNAIMALVLPNPLSFAAASWYYTSQSQCVGVRDGLKAGTQDGYVAFLTNCVQTTLDAAGMRLKYWQAAAAALGLPQ